MKTIAIYGNTAIIRVVCPECQCESFVRDSETVCCGVLVDATGARRIVRESDALNMRRRPDAITQRYILDSQEDRCFYCNQEFGSIQDRHGKLTRLSVRWDHQIPFAYSRDNSGVNFVAACQVCNGIKSDKMFYEVEDARAYLARRRKTLGWDY